MKATIAKSSLDPMIIAETRHFREDAKPDACDGGKLCWVRDGIAAYKMGQPGGCCSGCGGKPVEGGRNNKAKPGRKAQR